MFDAVGCGHTERYACAVIDEGDGSYVDCRDGSAVRAAATIAAARKEIDETDAKLSAQQTALERSLDALRQEQTSTGDLEKLASQSASHRHRGLGATLAPVENGVVVINVVPGGPSDGKLQSGDVIVSADGAVVTTLADLLTAVVHQIHGSPLAVTVKRDGDTRVVLIGGVQ